MPFWRSLTDPGNPAAAGDLGWNTGPPAAGTRPLTAELLQTEKHYAVRQWAEAVAICQQYLRQAPDNAMAWHRLGTIQIQQGQYPDAIGNLEQAVRIGGGVPADFHDLACASHGGSRR